MPANTRGHQNNHRFPRVRYAPLRPLQAHGAVKIVDRCSIITHLATGYSMIGYSMINAFNYHGGLVRGGMPEHPENKVFWGLIAAATAVLALGNVQSMRNAGLALHFKLLLAYLALAALSIAWAFKPELTAVRLAQQVIVVGAFMVPALVAGPSMDVMKSAYFWFAVSTIVNVLFVMGTPAETVRYNDGHVGYFAGKNYLGQFAGMVVLMTIYEVRQRGVLRRAGAVTIGVLSVILLFLSNSKTAAGLALVIPILAWLMVLAQRFARLSPASFCALLVVGWFMVSALTGITANRFSYMVYGDSTFTGRQIIWDFATLKMAVKPWLGWGYQSFWLVGPDGPSITNATGWVKSMPNAHNGYFDVRLELGYVGLVLLLAFLFATLHAIGRIAAVNAARGWLLLSLALFIIAYNFLESAWMRGFDYLWVTFLVVCAAAARNVYIVPAAATSAHAVRRSASGVRRHPFR